MKTFTTFFITSLFVGGIFLPLATYAQTEPAPTDYHMLAPIPGLTKGTSNATDIRTFIPGVVKLALGLSIAFALLMIIKGGIQYMSTDAVSGKSDGRESITNAVIGLLLAIGAYSLLYTINPRLLSLSLSLPNVGTTTPIGSDLGTTASSTDAIADPANWKAGASWPPDNQIRQTLLNAHIDVNKSNCVKIGDSNCTSVYGLSSRVGDSLISAERACESWKQSCRILVTGGTEYWLHGNRSKDISLNTTQHKPWGNVVDISLSNTAFHDFLKAKGSPASGTNCAPGSERYNYNGGLYVNEEIPGNAPHWHVCY